MFIFIFIMETISLYYFFQQGMSELNFQSLYYLVVIQYMVQVPINVKQLGG